jgi:dTDP-4-amino-4,6-dideoxygalactose transaminase
VARHNHGYYPVFIEAGFPLDRDTLYTRLREQGIIARRYFYPLISDFDMYRDAPGADHLPVARRMADTVLCLPLFGAMDDADVARVIDAVSAAART